ncbi:hypothetical protein C7475_101819 [Chitinophaga sp. S165]|nr:hypothetical protein C7475_101819 [Chitinophaga sp. S165]
MSGTLIVHISAVEYDKSLFPRMTTDLTAFIV